MREVHLFVTEREWIVFHGAAKGQKLERRVAALQKR